MNNRDVLREGAIHPVCAQLRYVFVLAVSVLAFCAPVTAPALIYWDSTGTDWGTISAWSTSATSATPNPAAVPGLADFVSFCSSNINTAQIVNLGSADRAVTTMGFLSSHTATTGLRGGGTDRVLTLAGGPGNGIYLQVGTGAVTIGSTTSGQGVSLLLNNNQVFSNASANSLTIFNAITPKAGAGGPFTISVQATGTGATILNGPISNATIVLGLVMNSSATGPLTLAGANSFTGGVTLTAGTININSTTALGAGSSVFSIATGTTIDNTSAGAIAMTNNNAQNWNGNFTFTGTNNLNLGTGTVALGSTTRQVTVSANTLTVGGVISGTGGLTLAGNGTLALGGANAFTGATTINGGTLTVAAASGSALGSTSSITVNSGGTLRLGANDQLNNIPGLPWAVELSRKETSTKAVRARPAPAPLP